MLVFTVIAVPQLRLYVPPEAKHVLNHLGIFPQAASARARKCLCLHTQIISAWKIIAIKLLWLAAQRWVPAPSAEHLVNGQFVHGYQ